MTKLRLKDLFCCVQKYANQMRDWKDLFRGRKRKTNKHRNRKTITTFYLFSAIWQMLWDNNSLYLQAGCLSSLGIKNPIVTLVFLRVCESVISSCYYQKECIRCHSSSAQCMLSCLVLCTPLKIKEAVSTKQSTSTFRDYFILIKLNKLTC